MRHETSALCIGLDIGGTTTSGLFLSPGADDSAIIAEPGLNLKEAGLVAVCDLIERVTLSVRSQIGFSGKASICAGIAGSAAEGDQIELIRCFQARCSGDHLQVLSDTTIALEGAFDQGSGMLCITGTGSVVSVRDHAGRDFTAGGWGAIVGDPASARQIGLESIRQLAVHLDSGGVTPRSRTTHDDARIPNANSFFLFESLKEEFGLEKRDDVIRFVFNEQRSSGDSVAALARLVISAAESGDTTANSILVSEIRDFTDQIVRLVEITGSVEKRYVHAGGMTNSALFRELFALELMRRLPDWQPVEAHASAAHGALCLALRGSGE